MSSPLFFEGKTALTRHLLEFLDLLFDKRVQIKDYVNYPWNVRGFVFAYFPEKNITKRGTGTLIGNSSVLTAAHVLHFKEITSTGYKYTPATKIEFFSALQEKKYLYSANSLKTYVPQKYLQNDSLYDYSLVKLDNDIGSKTGYASIGVATDRELDGKLVNVTGYPGM